MYDILAGDALEVVTPLLGPVFVGGNDQQGARDRALYMGQQERHQGCRQTMQEELLFAFA